MARLDITPGRHFFVGPNGQGKTNLLEAIGYVTALRSFRSAENRLLIQRGQPQAALAFDFDHERFGETRLTVEIRPGAREVWWEDDRVRRLADIIGKFPTVVFSSDDIQLVRGSPGGRRRWVDLTLAAMDAAYMTAIQHYHRSLQARNSLLKRRASARECRAFEQELAQASVTIRGKRRAEMTRLEALLIHNYQKISDSAEEAGFLYRPTEEATTEEEVLARLESGRERDLAAGFTLYGPHRDDFQFLLNGKPAVHYGSEGQQRGLILALRTAQVAYFKKESGLLPLILADDVLGELDPERRNRFWEVLDPALQLFATGTEVPTLPASEPSTPWTTWHVQEGNFKKHCP